jgi:hypothetical protein
MGISCDNLIGVLNGLVIGIDEGDAHGVIGINNGQTVIGLSEEVFD